MAGHADDILCVDLQLPSTLVTGSYDGVIIVWNIDSGAMKLRLQAPGCEQRLLTERSVEKVGTRSFRLERDSGDEVAPQDPPT